MVASIYEDDQKVGALTREAVRLSGSRLLQIHRFANTDESHANRLLEIFDPPKGIKIADVGCGVGHLAYLMTFKRPDLSFYLINKSREQLAMCMGLGLHGTAESLPINHADAVMVTYVLGHVDLEKFISECVRVKARHVYVFDLFQRDPFCDTRLKTDLRYEERTIADTILAFNDAGFKVTKQGITTFVSETIAAMMPSPETLNNTVSAALVFER